MSQPVRLRSTSHLRETIREYETTFLMFFSEKSDRVPQFTPIYNSLCARHSTPKIAFTKMVKEHFPELRDQCGVSRESALTLVVYKHGNNVGIVDIQDPPSLERCIERHVRPRQEVRLHPCCGDRRPQSHVHRRPPSPTRSKPPEQYVPRLVPLRIDPQSAARLGPYQTVPANMTHRRPHRNHVHENPAQLVYRGQDGRPRRARSVHITRDGNTPPEVTYLDESGPLAIERTL